MNTSLPLTLSRIAIGLAIIVILLGGWTRIMDAGLGCPDWPGCFGQLVVPMTSDSIAAAEQLFVDQKVDQQKGWLEMVHRYFAGTLGLIILGLAWLGWQRRHIQGYPVGLSIVLLALVIGQGVFGMWTVTLKLLPQIVTMHLLGGLLTLTLLISLSNRIGRLGCSINNYPCKSNSREWLMQLAVIVLFAQILLGGWTSANYAGWACNHWASCTKEIYSELDFRTGFSLSFDQQKNYQGGVLPQPARAAIQMVHRGGALVAVITLMLVAIRSVSATACRKPAFVLIVLLVLQSLLGFANALLGVPELLALIHHAGALALLLSLLWLKQRYESERVYGKQ